MERTCVVLKPDSVARGLVGEILARFERAGLKIVGFKMLHLTKEQAEKFYPSSKEWFISLGNKAKKSYEEKGLEDKRDSLEAGKWVKAVLVDYVTSGPVAAIALEGHSAVDIVRKLVGPTDPLRAPAGTIRGDYTVESIYLADSMKRGARNLLHASGSKEEAEHELSVLFKKEELHSYRRSDEEVLYGDLKKK